MSSFPVYLDARALEAADSWDNPDELHAVGSRVRDDLGALYRFLDKLDGRVAELRGPAVLPKPRYQTDKQRRVAVCPRCRHRETADA